MQSVIYFSLSFKTDSANCVQVLYYKMEAKTHILAAVALLVIGKSNYKFSMLYLSNIFSYLIKTYRKRGRLREQFLHISDVYNRYPENGSNDFHEIQYAAVSAAINRSR